MTKFQSTSPSGEIVTGTTEHDLSSAVVLWAWSNSCNDWLRQTDAEPVTEVTAYLQQLLDECPTVRPAMTPCVAA